MQKKKLFCTLFILAGLVALSVFQISDSFAEPAGNVVSIEAEGGFGGIARLGAWSNVTVKVRSDKRDISGEIEIEVDIDQARRVIFSKPVELTAGVEQEVDFEIPVVTVKKDIEIRFVENKKKVAETSCKFKRLLQPDIMMIGVLSEDRDAFNWLNGNTVPAYASNDDLAHKLKLMIAAGQVSPQIAAVPDVGGNVQKYEAVVIPLDRNTFPDKKEIMDNFDIVLISRYDTSLLNETQVSVMEEWVESGGLLVLGTGISWQKVYHGLPESLKPFSITGTEDVQTADVIARFTGRDAEGINLKLARGELEYMPVINETGEDNQYLLYDNYIIAGDINNPVAIKYRKENGALVVLTFDPTVEPFISWNNRTSFMENIFRYTANVIKQRFYDNGNGYYAGYYMKNPGQSQDLQYVATDIPFDKVPPYRLMFIILAVYVIVVGPVLYIILKIKDKRDWAWGLIPVLSVFFLSSMYLFGFKTRYNTAIANIASLVEIQPGSDIARVSSAIGVFNNRRGTLTIEYDNSSGINIPFIDQNYYRYGGDGSVSTVVAKYTAGDRNKLEQYNISLWYPKLLYAAKTIPFDGGILNNITIKDGRIKGVIENDTPYDLLDTVLIIGNNIIRVGDIVAGDSLTLDIPFDSKDVYKEPGLYLDAVYGKTWYPTPKDYPENFLELNQRRKLFEQCIYNVFNSNRGKPVFTMLAMNEQEFDYGLTVNEKAPQKYSKNLFKLESPLKFEPGREVEIPAGIIIPSFYQEKDIAWYDYNNVLYIRDTGDLEFEFILPENIRTNEIKIYSKNYIPLAMKYGLDQDSPVRTEILHNKYKFYLYNVNTKAWDEIEPYTGDGNIFSITLTGDISRYVGSGNEMRMKISVIELGMNNFVKEYNVEYYEELMTVPEIYIKGVSE